MLWQFYSINAGYAQIPIAGQVSISATSQSGNSIDICSGTITLNTSLNNTTGNPISNFTFGQSLPSFCNAISGSYTSTVIGSTVITSSTTINYTLPSLPIGLSTFAITIQIPCSISSILTNPPTPLTISSTVLTPTNYTITNGNYSFYPVIPQLVIDNFVDENNAQLSANVDEKLLVSPNHSRTFQIRNTNGKVDNLSLTYIPETELSNITFMAVGFLSGSTTSYGSLPLAASDLPNLSAYFTSLVGKNHLDLGDYIQITEHFDVTGCSPSPTNDMTEYQLTWGCPAAGNTNCNSAIAYRAISVITSNGRIGQSISLSQPFDITGVTPSNLDVVFTNPPHDANTVLGSNEKTLHSITFPMMRDFITYTSIQLGYPGGTFVDVNTIPGFYTYNSNTRSTTLNFDVLTTLVLGGAGPFEDGFIPNNLYNEIKENSSFILRFNQARFQCTAGHLSQNNWTETWADCNHDGGVNMMFSPGPGGHTDYNYQNMCGTSFSLQSFPGINHQNYWQVSSFSEADKSDVQVTETANLDFYYFSNQTITSNPFSYYQSGIGYMNYFNCSTVTYQALANLSDKYDLISIKYYPNPMSNAYTTLPVPSYTTANNIRTYLIPGISQSGRLSLNVQLVTCPMYSGGYDNFDVQIQAICNSCNSCALTLCCIEEELYHHCQGVCANPGATPPQSTYTFTFDRQTLGWTDETMSTQVSPSSSINLNRVYPCDEIKLTATGSLSSTPLTNGLAFAFTYTNPNTIYQFLDFVSGQLTYKLNSSGVPIQIPIQGSDLGSAYGSHLGWPTSLCPTCSLWVNLSANDVSILRSGTGSTFTLELTLKVKPLNSGNPAPPAVGYYKLNHLRGQFFSDAGISCDSWGDRMTVLNVQTKVENTTDGCSVLSPSFAQAGLGFTGHDWGYTTGLCDRRFYFHSLTYGGFKGIEDFPNEFRPVVQWPNTLKLQLKNNSVISWAQFFVKGSIDYQSGEPVNFFSTNLSPSVTEYAFTDFTHLGTPNTPWPLLDKKGNDFDYYLGGEFTNACFYTDTVTLPSSFEFTDHFYCEDPTCATQNPPGNTTILPVNSTSLVFNLSNSNPNYSLTSNSSLVIGYSTLQLHYYYAKNTALKYVYLQPLPPSGLTITQIKVNGAPLVQSGNYFLLPTNLLTQSSNGEVFYDVILYLNFTTCPPTNTIDLPILYGYTCANPVASNTGGATQVSCDSLSTTLHLTIEPANLSLGPVIAPSSPVNPCSNYTLTTTLASTLGGAVNNPTIQVEVPASVTILNVSSGAYTNLPITNNSPGIYTINLSSCVGNNPFSSGQTLPISITLTGGCANTGQNVLIKITGYGKTICGNDLTTSTQPTTISIPNLSTVNCEIGVASSTPANCATPVHITLTPTAIVHNGPATATILANFNPTFSYASSSVPPSIIGVGSVSWQFNLPAGNNSIAPIDLYLNIPANFCGILNSSGSCIISENVSCCTISDTATADTSLNICCTPCDSTHITINGYVSPANCKSANNGSIFLVVSGLNGPYTYLWSNGQTTSNIAGLHTGIYTVTVTNILGCTKKATYVVTALSGPQFNLSISPQPACVGTPIAFNATNCITCNTVQWNPFNLTGTSIVASMNTSGYVYALATDIYGCTNQIQEFVEVINCSENSCYEITSANQNETGNEIINTSDGGFAIVGSMHDANSDDQQMYFVKYKQDQTFEFSKLIGNYYEDDGILHVLNETGVSSIEMCDNFFIAGNSNYSDRDSDIVLSSIDRAGNVIWCYHYGRGGNDIVTKICSTGDGTCEYLYVTGYTNSFSKYDKSYDMFLMKIKAETGVVVDFKLYGNEKEDDFAYSLTPSQNSDGFFIAGVNSSNNKKSAILVKTNQQLSLIDQRQFYTGFDNGVYDITESDGYVFLTGTGSATSDINDVLLLKVEEKFMTLINAIYVGNDSKNEIGYSIHKTPEGKLNFLVAGQSNDALKTEGILLRFSLEKNPVIDWFNQTSNISEAVAFKGVINSNAQTIAATGYYTEKNGDMNIFVVKTANDGVNCCMTMHDWKMNEDLNVTSSYKESKGDFRMSDYGLFSEYYKPDIICSEDNSPYPLRIGLQKSNTISVYPNPSSGNITVELIDSKDSILNVQVKDVTGRAIVSDAKYLNSVSCTLKLNTIKDGLYYLTVITASGSKLNERIIIEK